MNPGRGKVIGKWGEDQACAFLIRHGFFIKDRNFYCTVGELDIVAQKDNDYYFIEVKTRMAGELASDLAITPSKKHKLKKTVGKYCYEKDIAEAGLILAGLMVIYDNFLKKVTFKFSVFG